MIKIYSQCHPNSTVAANRPLYDLTSRGLDSQLFFINGIDGWNISSLFLELKSFISAQSMELLKSFMLILLLDGHV